VAASAACDDAGGGGGWDGIELASDAVDRNVQAAAAAAAAASSAVARAVVGSVDGPPVQAYTFLTLVNTQYDDEVGCSRWRLAGASVLPPFLRAALLFSKLPCRAQTLKPRTAPSFNGPFEPLCS
jgi:hypothetical protein